MRIVKRTRFVLLAGSGLDVGEHVASAVALSSSMQILLYWVFQLSFTHPQVETQDSRHPFAAHESFWRMAAAPALPTRKENLQN